MLITNVDENLNAETEYKFKSLANQLIISLPMKLKNPTNNRTLMRIISESANWLIKQLP